MRRYDIVTGILLVLSIIDFALAAPLLAQEKHQSRVDVVHIPKDVTTVLGKRWEEELEKLGEEYLKTSGKSIDSSGIHSSSSSAPSGLDHPSTDVVPVRPSAPDLASSTTTGNPESSMDLSCPPSDSQGLRARGNSWKKTCLDLLEDMSKFDGYAPPRGGPMMYSSPYHEPDYGSYSKLPAEPPSIEMHSMNPPAYHDSDWNYWSNPDDLPQPPSPPRRPKDIGQASGHGPGPPLDPGFSWPEPPPREFYSTKVISSASPGTVSPTELEHDAQMLPEPATSANLELHSDHQSLSAGVQQADLQDYIYKMKGKAKEERRDSGTARDVGDAAQRELHGAEMSVDSGE
jgi:hypothetical protein